MKRLPNVISELRIAGSIVVALATFAAVQEGHLIRKKQLGKMFFSQEV